MPVYFYVLVALVLFTVTVIGGRLISKRFRLWFCKHGIHGLWNGSAESFDGCSVHLRCPHCGRKVMVDSQGNMF